ncbi:flavodoxin family protein [uncultured Traorella sp.]|uniref:flavodoxin family protein n=1 Tax=uncultured Traorella sp. TaxID=1929048 RepID=UPI0025FE980F|nr:flavodoxin family protein [uncultured Traorella sp.]
MKVVVIRSSPRKDGNSDVLCDQFAKGAMESGHSVINIHLRKKKLSPCNACYGCMKDHVCSIKDDMADILRKMIEADVIVMATPIYFYSLSAQIKILIDRCLSNYREIKDKKFYFIVTAADPQREAAQAALMSLRGFLDCLDHAEEAGVIYGMGAWDKGDIYKHPAYLEAYESGKRLGGEWDGAY